MTTPVQINLAQEVNVQPLKGLTMIPTTTNVNAGTEFESSTIWVNNSSGHLHSGNVDLETGTNWTTSATLKNTNAATGDILTLTNGPSGFGIYAPSLEYQWASQAGGSPGFSLGYDIAVDASGNVYITGGFTQTATFGTTTLTSVGNYDIFVAKLDPNGAWLWAVQAGGAGGADLGHGLSVDDLGNVYIAGYFGLTATFGATTLVSSGSNDIFVAKLDTNGGWLWAVKAGGTGTDINWLGSIALDPAGNVFVCGWFGSPTITFGATTLTLTGGGVVYDTFVAKLDTNGNWLWAVQTTGTAIVKYALAIATDSVGNAYIAGNFGSAGNAVYGTTTLTNIATSNDIIVAKISSGGTWLWAIRGGGTVDDQSYSITLDPTGNIYITGLFSSPTCKLGNTILTRAGVVDALIAKISPNGSWMWAVRAGGTSADRGWAVTVDTAGNVYTVGAFSDTATFGPITLVASGGSYMYLAKLDTNGNWLWAYQVGGGISDAVYGVSVDPSGVIYIAGVFNTTSSFGSFTLTATNQEVFVLKTSPVYQQVVAVATQAGTNGNPINIAWNGPVASFTGLTAGQFYYYNPPSKIPTTTPTMYKLGYALNSTTILLAPDPRYLI